MIFFVNGISYFIVGIIFFYNNYFFGILIDVLLMYFYDCYKEINRYLYYCFNVINLL